MTPKIHIKGKFKHFKENKSGWDTIDDSNDHIYEKIDGNKFVIKRGNVESLFYLKMINDFGGQ